MNFGITNCLKTQQKDQRSPAQRFAINKMIIYTNRKKKKKKKRKNNY